MFIPSHESVSLTGSVQVLNVLKRSSDFVASETDPFLRPCLHGVGDPGLVGLVSFVFTLWGTQNKRNLPQ